jgi:hypothetical protein
MLAAETAIPTNYLGFQTDNPASADASVPVFTDTPAVTDALSLPVVTLAPASTVLV